MYTYVYARFKIGRIQGLVQRARWAISPHIIFSYA